MRLLLEFKDHPKEQAIIGQMIMAYGEFEFQTAALIGHAMGGDDNTAARLFFRIHGEGPRLDVADAIVRPFFAKNGLAGQWGNTFGALKYCKDIRNQYAHCNWLDPEGPVLTFVTMDKDVASPEGTLSVQLYPVDLQLLKKQHQYFEYAGDWLFFLSCRCRRAAGQKEIPDPATPKSIPQPPRHNRTKKPPQPPACCTIPKEHPGE